MTSWLDEGAQPHAPVAQLLGKSDALEQQSAVPTVPPLAVQGSVASPSVVEESALDVSELLVSLADESEVEESLIDVSFVALSCVDPSV